MPIPPDQSNKGSPLKRTATLCGVLVALVGLGGLLGWYTGVQVISRVRAYYKPIAPSTAGAFLILGSILFLYTRGSLGRKGRDAAAFLAAALAVFGLLEFLEYPLGVSLTFEEALFPGKEPFGQVVTNRMSPITGITFFLAGLSLLLLLRPGTGRWDRHLPGGLGALVGLSASIEIMGYLFGTPLMYGGSLIPVAAPTCLGFLILGLGLIAGAGPQCYPLRFVAGSSVQARLLRAFLPLTVGAVLVQGWLHFLIPKAFEDLSHAMVSSLLAIVFAGITSLVVILVGGTIGQKIDGMEAERCQAELSLRREQEFTARVMETSPVGIMVLTHQGQISFVNAWCERIFEIGKEVITSRTFNAAALHLTDYEGNPMGDADLPFRRVVAAGRGLTAMPLAIQAPSGRRILLSCSGAPLWDDAGRMEGVVFALQDVTALREAEEALRRREKQYRNLVENMNDGLVSVNLEGQVTFANSRLCQMLGYAPEEIVGHPALDFFDEANREIAREQFSRRQKGESQPYEVALTRKNGDKVFALVSPMAVFHSDGNFHGSISVITDLSDRKRAEEQAREQLKSLTSLVAGVEQLARIRDPDAMVREICQLVVTAFDAQLVWLGWADPDGVIRPLYWTGPKGDYLKDIEVRWDDSLLGRCPGGRAIREGVPVILNDLENEPSFTPWRDAALKRGFRSVAAIPLSHEERTFASLYIYADCLHYFTPERVDLLQAFARIAAAALENSRLSAKVEKHVQQLEALRQMDLAISGSLDLRLTLNVLLDQLMALVKVDAATVQLLNPHSLVVEYAASRGFRAPSMAQGRILLGQGLRGRIALERVPLYIPDLATVREQAIRASWLSEEKFVSYYGFPLINKGQIRGVMEIFYRSSLQVEEELRGFLEALAGQAAIAIDNATLFQEMERSHQELSLAYEATLEGWAKALELRDLETKGHSQRVTVLTLELARRLGVPETDLVHFYRGALLHDIGKLAIPDAILFKQGSFTEEEWEIMRRHPVCAHHMISAIPYLRPALDIPYCHHERWDGSGYPRGLRGEEIPLAARIFAVVDVWDAMNSHRPYRPAMAPEKVIQHLEEQAGILFDPKVVAVFLDEVLPTINSAAVAV